MADKDAIRSPFSFRGVTFPPHVDLRALEQVESFEVRDDDVFVCAYPRSGTTWTQQIVSLVTAGSNFSEVSKISLKKRVPWLEGRNRAGEEAPPFISLLKTSSSPRLMKTHLPYRMLPKQAREGKGKIIYCARNPKDVIVSIHHLWSIEDLFGSVTWEDTLQAHGPSGSDAVFGQWWDVVPEYWRHKDDNNLLFIKYEDMKKDLRSHVVKIADFLGKTLSDEQIDEVTANCTFTAMKENPATNWSRDPVIQEKDLKRGKDRDLEFIRKGQVGDWRNMFTPQQLETFESLHRQKMAGIDLTFEDEE